MGQENPDRVRRNLRMFLVAAGLWWVLSIAVVILLMSRDQLVAVGIVAVVATLVPIVAAKILVGGRRR